MSRKIVYVVAPTQGEFLKWIGKQDPNGNDPDADTIYRYYRPEIGIRCKRPRFLFLAEWQRRADWRTIYNRAIAQGKRWWEK